MVICYLKVYVALRLLLKYALQIMPKTILPQETLKLLTVATALVRMRNTIGLLLFMIFFLVIQSLVKIRCVESPRKNAVREPRDCY